MNFKKLKMHIDLLKEREREDKLISKKFMPRGAN
jgi:hypothetical protein